MDINGRTHPLIVVGVDGSRSSVAALAFAKEYAERRHGRLRAVSVWSYPISYNPLPVTWSPEKDAEFQLRMASKEVFGHVLPDWYEQTVREGSAARNLLDESRTADALIVGSRGHGGFAGLLLGSVSAQCAAHSHCPAIVIHADHTAAGAGAGSDQTEHPLSARGGALVVGYDGSANADDALAWALAAAEDLGAPVTVVRTWSIDRIPRESIDEFGHGHSFDDVTAQVRRDLVSETQSLIDAHPRVAVTLQAVLSQPAEELIRRSKDASMVVVGSRGRGGFVGLLLGSVSAECASHGMCPVVVVPAGSRTGSRAALNVAAVDG
ncbi:universal stress protein [Subtercola sp. RTI3]|uniref:universal stress protein n=1 Tax=Subtercola sp. RTI3 TaxID=3048639 RepID=UPI002B225E78|nr:universal stress protein [Subtercola sp. RTI3]MEA9984865.1 universal stress protein [Subtercola sp. RTI3]